MLGACEIQEILYDADLIVLAQETFLVEPHTAFTILSAVIIERDFSIFFGARKLDMNHHTES